MSFLLLKIIRCSYHIPSFDIISHAEDEEYRERVMKMVDCGEYLCYVLILFLLLSYLDATIQKNENKTNFLFSYRFDVLPAFY